MGEAFRSSLDLIKFCVYSTVCLNCERGISRRINAKTCTSEVLAVGGVEPGTSGHVFLSLSQKDLPTTSLGSKCQVRNFSARLGSRVQAPLPYFVIHDNIVSSPLQIDIPSVMEELLRGVLAPGCTVHHVHQSDSPNSPNRLLDST